MAEETTHQPHKHAIMGQYRANAASIGAILACYWPIPAYLQGNMLGG